MHRTAIRKTTSSLQLLSDLEASSTEVKINKK